MTKRGSVDCCFWVGIAALVLFALSSSVRGVDQKSLERYYQPNLCGPVALYCVCRAYDVETSIGELTRLSGYDGRGTSVAGIASAARAKSFEVEALNSSVSHLKTLQQPAIIDFPTGHFCVIFGWEDGRARILDPPHTLRLVEPDELAKSWGKHVVTFTRPSR